MRIRSYNWALLGSLLAAGLVVGVPAAALFGPSWLAVPMSDFAKAIGGASGVAALATSLTGIAVFYYLVETSRLRSETEAQRKPFVVPQWEENVLPESLVADLGPEFVDAEIVLRNVGGGPAIGVVIEWRGIPKASAGLHNVAVLSGATGAAQILGGIGGRHPHREEHVYERLVLSVQCRSVSPTTGTGEYSWRWIRDKGVGGGFRLQAE